MNFKGKKHFTTYSLVLIALFAAILCISAYISIPLPNGSHISLLNFSVTLITLIFPISNAFFIILVWILLGICGVPVFIGGNAGIGYLFGQYGGYVLAFIIISLINPLIRGQRFNRIRYTIVSVLSAIIVDITGTLWIMLITGCSLRAAILIGFVPFIILDIVKAVLAAQAVPAFRKLLYIHDNFSV